MIPSLAKINWYDFLDRPPLPSASSEAITSFAQGPILITGAGGSLGSALAKVLAGAAKLLLLESSETSLIELQTEFAELQPHTPPVFCLGSATDRGLLNEICAIHAPRTILHAAAFKHVPLLEEHPLAAVSNNVFSTEAVVATAIARKIRVILLSTDKAVEPVSVMGAAKRVAEQIVLVAGGNVLRLGNVLGSSGSVTELFARQIAAGRPLTVTDPAARRYFLTISESVGLLLEASNAKDVSSLFVPKLHEPHFIADLARFMARAIAPNRDVPIEFTHLRAGEKEVECLWSADENPRQTRSRNLARVESPLLSGSRLQDLLGALSKAVESRDVGTVLSILCELVPDYTPSATVLACRSNAEPAHHES